MSEEMVMLTLEEKLAADSDGVFKTQLVEQLQTALVENRRTMDAGVPPAEFARLNKLVTALEAAQTVVDGVWGRLHSPQG